MPENDTLKVLNVGSGVRSASKLHRAFQQGWSEIRVDIDAGVTPDIVCDMTNMDMIASGSIDAVWSSHNLEHLNAHEVLLGLQEFRRVLRRDGFALINCPDLTAIAQLIVAGKVDEAAYVSPAGPITALDMVFGHSNSIAAGNHFMAHRTGFTTKRLGNLLLAAQFPEAWVFPGQSFDLWAVALMSNTDRDHVRRMLIEAGIEFP